MRRTLAIYAAGILTAAAIVYLLSRRVDVPEYVWTSADGTVSVSWAGVAG